MSKNFVAPGNLVDLTAPPGGVVSGNGYKIGGFVGFAANSANAGDKFPLAVTGIHGCSTDTGTAWVEGDVIFWDDNAKVFTKTSAGNTRAGGVCVPKAAADTVSTIRLNATV